MMDTDILDKSSKILEQYFENDIPEELAKAIRLWFINSENQQEKKEALRRIWEQRVKFDNRPGK